MVRRVNGAKMYSRYFYEFNSLSERVKNTFQLQKRLKNDPCQVELRMSMLAMLDLISSTILSLIDIYHLI